MTDIDNSDSASQNPAEGGRGRRSVKNVFVKPREQLRYAFVFFGGGLALMAGYIVIFLYYLNVTIMNLATSYSIAPDVATTLNTAFLTASIATVVFAATLTLIMFAAGIALSHRIFGPIVPMKKLIEELKAGKYSARVTLRKSDEFQDVAVSLNELAEKLEKSAR